MGQYYHAVILSPSTEARIVAAYNPHHYDNGAKLTEHSWIENNFVQTVESTFMPGEIHYKNRLVWAGDYADPEEGTDQDLYDMSEAKLVKTNDAEVPEDFRFLINHTKRIYLDKNKQLKDGDGWKFHPLPLLTCEGNGQGGGDYFSTDPDQIKHVGSWARDIISVDSEIPADYEEINVSF